VALLFLGMVAVGTCLSESMVAELGEEESAPLAPKTPTVLGFATKMERAMSKMQGSRTNWQETMENVRNGVVQLRVVQEQFLWSMPYRTPLRETVFGSGWLIDNKEFGVNTMQDILIVTNAHVAKQASSISVLIPALGQEPIAAEAVGICVTRDIALLRIKEPLEMLKMYKLRTGEDDIVRMKLGDSDKLMRGAPVMAVGYPLGMQSVKASMGIVSGYQQFKSTLYMSMTAAINPGNSGGPLYNKNGEVVGINSAKFTKASGIAFAIPSHQLRVTLDTLYTQRELVEPELGIIMSAGTTGLNEYLTGMKSKGGVYVKDTLKDGLFAQAGGNPGDLLLAVDDHKIDDHGMIWMPKLKDRFNLNGMLLRHKFGAPLTFHAYRAGPNKTGKLLKLTTKYAQTKRSPVHKIYETVLERPRYVTAAGFVFMELNLNLVEANLRKNPTELVKYMDPQNRGDKAVFISNVVPGSLAHADGSAKQGLIVERVNGMKVKNFDELCAALNAKVGKDSFWTVTTAKTFTAFKLKQVVKYESRKDPDNFSLSKGCSQGSVLEMLSR
jgi:S1-C subfamily serine protease